MVGQRGQLERERDNWSSLSLSTPLLPIVVAPSGLELVPNWTRFWDKHFCPFNGHRGAILAAVQLKIKKKRRLFDVYLSLSLCGGSDVFLAEF